MLDDMSSIEQPTKNSIEKNKVPYIIYNFQQFQTTLVIFAKKSSKQEFFFYRLEILVQKFSA
jgi:hypothetical protein